MTLIDGVCYSCGIVMFNDWGEEWLGTVCLDCLDKLLGVRSAGLRDIEWPA